MKATILASSRNEEEVKIIFVKNQEFINLFIKLKGTLHLDWGVFEEQNEETGEISINNINDYKDQLIEYKDKHINIQIFIGDEKIILNIKSSTSLQQQIVDEVMKEAQWKTE